MEVLRYINSLFESVAPILCRYIKKRMPPPQLPRIEELEYWGSGGEKERLARKMAGGNGETITISTELYERV